MEISILESALESLTDCFLVSNFQEVKDYVDRIRWNNSSLNQRELAQKIVDEQSLSSGLLGSVTGLSSSIALPITITFDIVKAWKIQDFMLRCIAYIYGHTPKNTDLKKTILLLMSEGSVEELKKLVFEESTNVVNQYTLNTIENFKNSTIQIAAKEVPKQAVNALNKYGEQAIVNCGMKEISKSLMEVMCKVGGKKIAENVMEKSFVVAVPVIGAIIGGSVDWMTTQAVGKLAIEYFESGSDISKMFIA